MEPEKLFLGIDGGGSRVRARLEAAEGRLLGYGEAGAANPRVGVGAAWANILTAVAQTGLQEKQLASVKVCMGLAGAGRLQDRERFLAHPHPFRHLRLETDVHIAWAGAHGGEEGGVIIVGTGAIGYTPLRRIGGWGFVVGDEGSGAWLGREAVRACLRAIDGRGQETGLRKAVLERWGPGVEDLMERVLSATPADFAMLAPAVLGLAQEGDIVALSLAKCAGEEIALLDPDPRLPLCLLGGLAEVIRPYLPEYLLGRLRPAKGDALSGALRLARG